MVDGLVFDNLFMIDAELVKEPGRIPINVSFFGSHLGKVRPRGRFGLQGRRPRSRTNGCCPVATATSHPFPMGTVAMSSGEERLPVENRITWCGDVVSRCRE